MGKFVIYRTDTGFRFELRAANGETIAGSEVYRTHAACLKGAGSVAKCAAGAGLADLAAGTPGVPNPRFELYQGKDGAYRFRLRSRNGQIIASSEGYTTRAACENGIESVRVNAPGASLTDA